MLLLELVVLARASTDSIPRLCEVDVLVVSLVRHQTLVL